MNINQYFAFIYNILSWWISRNIIFGYTVNNNVAVLIFQNIGISDSICSVIVVNNFSRYVSFTTGRTWFFWLPDMALSNVLNAANLCLHLKLITKKLHYLNNIERSWDMAEAILIIFSQSSNSADHIKQKIS